MDNNEFDVDYVGNWVDPKSIRMPENWSTYAYCNVTGHDIDGGSIQKFFYGANIVLKFENYNAHMMTLGKPATIFTDKIYLTRNIFTPDFVLRMSKE